MFKSLKFYSILAVIGLLIFFHYLHILLPIENFILNILNPIQEKIYNFGQKFNNFCSNGADQLYKKISALTIENAKLKILEEENQILKKELNFLEESQNKFVMARIVGRDPTLPNTLILNKGEKDGIKINFPVVANEGILVGKIIKTEEKISIALLITDSKSKVAASILSQQDPSALLEVNENDQRRPILGIVEGSHGLSIKMELIPQNEKVQKGDLVITSGLEKDIPQGLVIGEIESVKSEPDAVFQSATVKSLIPLDNLSIVAVIIPTI